MADGEELSEAELEVVGLLESNDAGASDALLGLDEVSRARVLRRVSGSGRVDVADSMTDAGALSGDDESESGEVFGDSGPAVSAVVENAVGSARRMWGDRLGRLRLVVVGVVLVVLMVLMVRACSGDGGGGGDLLLMSGADDLYVVDANNEVDRDGRVTRDVDGVSNIVVTEGGESVWTTAATVQGRRVVVTHGSGSGSVWVIDGLDSERLVDADDGSVSVTVVDGVLFVQESSGATQRCHRGSVEEFEVVYRGDVCRVVRSGHVLGARESSTGAFRAEVFGPDGGDDELFSGSFESLPTLSGNGRFLVAEEQRGVSVTHVESGEEVWDLRGGTSFSVASHLDGSTVVAVETDESELLLVGFDREGNPAELAEVSQGQIRGEFAANGDFYWIEHADEVGTLFMWQVSDDDVERLDEDDDLWLVGVHGNAAVTVIADDLGVEFRRYPGSDDYRELDDVKADINREVIDGDYIYLEGVDTAAVVPLDGGDATESDFYDDIELLEWHNGTLVFAAYDGFSTTLVSIRSGEEQEIEYDRYDQIHSVEIDGNTLIATVQDGRAPRTIQLDINSGKERDGSPEYNDFTLIRTATRPYVDSVSGEAFGR